VEHVKGASKSFKKQLSHIAPSLKYVRESKEIISIYNLMEETEDFYIDRFGKQIRIVIKRNGREFNLNFNKGKLVQILDNIIINSEYWLKQKKRREPKFLPELTIETSEPFIRIFDNGNGIDATVEDQIFQPFITTKPKKEGRGL